mgnify:CR=1 FL=1
MLIKKAYILLVMLTMSLTLSAQSVNVGVMLPLHDVDGDGRRMTEYYRGILLAVERLKSDGMNINIHAWNVPIDADPRTTLLQEGAQDCNVIFGPLYTKQVKVIGDFCRAYNINMVIPFSISGNDVDHNPNIYQVYQSPDELNTKAIQQVAEHFTAYHPVFIDCNDTTSQKGAFTFALRKILEQKGITYNITNLHSSSELFAKAFSLNRPNLVILNSGRSPELTRALNRLDELTQANANVQISLFGYTEWLMYAKLNRERFCKYDAYVPSTFYYNESSMLTRELNEEYSARFGKEMMYALPHFALTGFDHAMYFIGNRRSWVQTPLIFIKQGNGSGYRNKAFMLVHYKTNGSIESVMY